MGSIPALAGERAFAEAGRRTLGVYPRACGGTLDQTVVRVPHQGLSPRLRGNADASGLERTSVGSIPALAGERRG